MNKSLTFKNDKCKLTKYFLFQERLRTKIVDRLVKEGSNADEPTNISLSDYSRY